MPPAGRIDPTWFQTMRDALAATGRPVVYSLSTWEFDEWNVSTGQLWRTTGDTTPDWTSIASNIAKNRSLAPYAGPNHWNDPDMLEVGNDAGSPPLSLTEQDGTANDRADWADAKVDCDP